MDRYLEIFIYSDRTKSSSPKCGNLIIHVCILQFYLCKTTWNRAQWNNGDIEQQVQLEVSIKLTGVHTLLYQVKYEMKEIPHPLDFMNQLNKIQIMLEIL